MTILRALKTLPSHKLVVIGHGGDYKIKCQKFVEDNKMSHRVQFLKIDDTHELAAIYQMARIMILPLCFRRLWHSNYRILVFKNTGNYLTR